jgi:hypothetical protein
MNQKTKKFRVSNKEFRMMKADSSLAFIIPCSIFDIEEPSKRDWPSAVGMKLAFLGVRLLAGGRSRKPEQRGSQAHARPFPTFALQLPIHSLIFPSFQPKTPVRELEMD